MNRANAAMDAIENSSSYLLLKLKEGITINTPPLVFALPFPLTSPARTLDSAKNLNFN